MQIPYRGLNIEIPIQDALQVEYFCLKQALNEHTVLSLKILVEETQLVKAVEDIKESSCIKVKQEQNQKEKIIFQGKPLQVSMCEERGSYYLVVECVSYTYDWDLEKKSQSFCDLDSTYKDIIKKVLNPYKQKDFQDQITNNKKIPDFLLQYEETDWSFLKRIATHFETFLLEDPTKPYGCIHFGLPKLQYNTSLNKDDFIINKDFEKYYYFNALEAYIPQETITWNIQTQKRLYLGEEVLLNNIKTQVTKVTIATSKDDLVYSYELSRLKGVRIPYQMNPQIFGMSIPAVVKERKGNSVRVHFDIDPTYTPKPNLKYFTYAIESSSFYCMPEEGSKVHIYFPSHDEKEAIAVHAIRTASADAPFAGRAQNPNHKSFSNVTGSEMKMTERDISYAADEAKKISITLDQDGNINLVGRNITLKTDKSFSIGERESQDPEIPPVKPKCIHITAKEKLSLVREDDESQGITLDEEARIIATFMRKECSVKNPPTQSAESFLPNRKDDQAAINAINDGAKAQLEAKRKEGKDKIRKGLCSVLKVAAMGALIVATGGMAAGPLLAAVVVTGAAQTVMAVSDVVEGVQDYKKSVTGDLTRSYNPIRDTLFGGNEELYNMVQGGVEMAFGIVSSIAVAGNIKELAKVGKLCKSIQQFSHMGMNAVTSMMDSYANTGKIDVVNLGYNLGLGYITGNVGGGITNKIFEKLGDSSSKVVQGILNSPVGKKAAEVTVETFVDTTIDGGVALLSNQPFDVKKSAFNNLAANLLSKAFGEPIDVVTGAFFMNATDFKLPDLETQFLLKRQYTSINKRVGLLGKGWTLNIDSRLCRDGERIYADIMTGHTVSFTYEDGEWKNIDGENGRFKLSRDVMLGEWEIRDLLKGQSFIYNSIGLMVMVLDKNNQKLVLEYNGEQLEKITTRLGYQILFAFEGEKLAQVTDGLGRTLQYRYEGDLLTHVVHLDQGITTYTYTKEGYIETAIDKNGVTYLKNTYDEQGRAICQELPTGYTYEATYDTANRITTVNYNQGEKLEHYHYNQDLLVTQIDYMDGSSETYQYDAYKNCCYEKNRRGYVTERVYSPYNYVLEEKHPNGRIITFTYNQDHQLTAEKDNYGSETSYGYDDNHNLLEEKRKIAQGKWQTITYTRDAKGRILTKQDSLGGKIEYSYEPNQSEPSYVKNAMGEMTYYTYDQVGRRMSIENDYGVVEFGYNNLNYVTEIKDGEGHITKKEYDPMGKLIGFYPPKAWANKEKGYGYKYDFLDRLVEVVDPLGHHYQQESDVDGNIIKKVNPNTYNRQTKEGLATTYTYNMDNKCTRITYLDGGIERFFYDSEGNLIKHVLPEYYNEETDDGKGYTYTYNEMNQLEQVIHPDGQVEKTYVYDFHGNIVEETNALGHTTFYKYNLLGQLIEKREPVKEEDMLWYKLTCYEYDLNGNKTAEKYGQDFVGAEDYPKTYHTIYQEYDSNNHLIKVKDDYGAMISYGYNCLGQRSYEERKINETIQQSIRYIYNKAGLLTQKKEAMNDQVLGRKADKTIWLVTKYKHDENGNLIEIVTPKGYKIERNYDACDRMISERVIDHENGIDRTTMYTYDAAHNIIAVEEKGKDVEATKSSYTYDLKNRLTHITVQEEATTRYFYDKNDRLVKEVDPENYDASNDDGIGTIYVYDMKGNITAKTNALGQKVEENEYDLMGRLLCQKDALGNPIHYTYNLDGQVKEVATTRSKEEGRALQSYDYNARGQIIAGADGNRHETFYQVDGWGRITQVIAADGGVEKYSYNYAGQITSTTDANGNTITYCYNSFGKVSEIIDQEGVSEYFYYDEEGRLTVHIDRNGNRVENSYNVDGNLTEQMAYERVDETTDKTINKTVKSKNPIIKRYTYNSKGQLLVAKADGFAYNYRYTPEGYLESKSTCGRILTAYTYNKKGQITSIKDVTGKTTYYSYDPLGRLSKLTDDKGNTVAKYTYTANDLIESIIYGNNIRTVYSYDSDQNVTHLLTTTSDGEKLQDFDYTYDLNGNRLGKVGLGQSIHYDYDSMNRLVKAKYNEKEESFTYDLVGNRLTRTTNGETETYLYNGKNQLIELHRDLGVTSFTYDSQGNILKESSPKGITSFSYNPLGQQVKVTTHDGNTLINRYDAENLRAEIEENQKLTRFIFHRGEILVETDEKDSPIARFTRGYDVVAGDIVNEESGGIAETREAARYYYQLDEQRSTAFITSETAKVENFYQYDAFGNVLESKERLHNRITYTGQQYDSVTQQYYLRARFYNPVLGRFMQEDVYRGDGLNLYAYCRNNPVMYYDPSGYAKNGNACGDKDDCINSNEEKVDTKTLPGIGDVDNSKEVKKLNEWLAKDKELLDEVTEWYNTKPEWWGIDPENTDVFYRTQQEVNKIRKKVGESGGHHPHGLALGGPEGQKLTPTGETVRIKNPTHSQVTGLQRRVINRIKKTQNK